MSRPNTELSEAQVKALVRLRKKYGPSELARKIPTSRTSIYRWTDDGESRKVDRMRLEAIERLIEKEKP